MPERSFGRTVRYRRTKLGISQARLGQLVGRTPATIRSWESDKSVPNDAAVLATLAAIIGVDERMLFEKAGLERPVSIETSPTIEEALATLAPDLADPDQVDTRVSDAIAELEPGALAASTEPLFDTVPEERADELEHMLEEFEDDDSSPGRGVEGHGFRVGRPPGSANRRTDATMVPTRPVDQPPAPVAMVAEASYIEDPVEKRFYQVRTLATVAGVVVLGAAFLWAVSQGLGAFTEWVSEFLELLRI